MSCADMFGSWDCFGYGIGYLVFVITIVFLPWLLK